MKKTMAVLLLACAAGALCAQNEVSGANGPLNAVSVDLFPLFKGVIASEVGDKDTVLICVAADYERLVATHFSVGGAVDVHFGKVWDEGLFYFGAAVLGRYYPLSEKFEKFFMGTELGFNFLVIDGNIKDNGFAGFTAALEAGYKLMFREAGNFFVEPSLSYVLSKSNSYMATPLGWQGGLSLGLVF